MLGFIPLDFISKILMRHILDGDYSRESVINEEVNEGFHLYVVNDHIEAHWNIVNEVVNQPH